MFAAQKQLYHLHKRNIPVGTYLVGKWAMFFHRDKMSYILL